MARDYNPPDLTGKQVLITGATSGIGRQTALELAAAGASVAVVSRDRERGTATADWIAEAVGRENVELFIADLASLAQVRELAEKVKQKWDSFDLLINNAGIIVGQRALTAEGLELTFTVNHLAPFLLTNLLLGQLKAAETARVVTVASDAHRSGRIDFDNLQGERGYRPFGQYANTKLANILFTRELARRLEGTGVTANCLHPGLVRTRLIRRGSGGVMRLLWALGAPFFISVKKGAITSLKLATAPELAGVSGQYFNRGRQAKTSAAAGDMDLARRLWEVSEELTGLA